MSGDLGLKMADFSKTVSNNLEMFGGGSASYFDAYNWGEFYWGDGTAPIIHTVGKTVGSTITLTSESSEIYLRDQAGWLRNYPDRVTNANSRYVPTWTQVTANSSVA